MLASLRIALRSLGRNALRSFLTTLGLIVGVSAVIVGVSMGAGAKAEVEKRIADMGQNLLIVFSGNFSRGGARGGFGQVGSFTLDDYETIRREVAGVSCVSPEVRTTAQVVSGSANTSVGIWGVSTDFVPIRSWRFRSGDNFTEANQRDAAKVCILGATTAMSLFGEGNDPVGQIIRIKNAPYVVIGWLEPKGTGGFGQDQDDLIIMPYTSAMKRLAGESKFRALNVQAESAEVIDEVQNQVAALLRQRHNIEGGKEDDFTIRNQQDMSDFANANNRIMTILIGFFAGISLVVGGIGIMNIMLVNVTERTREIGIRLAVGARTRDILRQFLTEAVILSLGGGLLGIGAGYGLAPALTKLAGFPTLISTESVILAFTVSWCICVVFGFFPALKAGRLDAIEALRYE